MNCRTLYNPNESCCAFNECFGQISLLLDDIGTIDLFNFVEVTVDFVKTY